MENRSTGKHNRNHERAVTPRRDFLKTMGAVSAGGMAAMLLPNVNTARADRLTAAQALSGYPTTKQDEKFWKKIQKEFVLKKGLIYMNTGTEGAMPKFVLNNMQKDFEDFAAFPMDTVLNDDRCNMFMSKIVPKVARFIGAADDEIVMTTNTTEGTGWIANGLNLQPGDEVVTHLHFPPYNAAWFWLRERVGIGITEVEIPTPTLTSQEVIDAFEAAITPKTKVMSFCHINYTTGLRMPVKELCELARQHKIITLVDGAHTIGMIDLNMHDMGVDFYACSPHKWLCAPPGTGVLYMRKEAQQFVTPVVTEQDRLGEVTEPISTFYFQVRGQQPSPALAGVPDAMDFQDEIGKDRIEDRILTLSAYMKERLIENWGEDSILSPLDQELSSGLVSFNPRENKFAGDHCVCAPMFYALWDRNIVGRSLGWKNKHADSRKTRTLRFSTHLYNSFDQIDTVIENIQDILEPYGL